MIRIVVNGSHKNIEIKVQRKVTMHLCLTQMNNKINVKKGSQLMMFHLNRIN